MRKAMDALAALYKTQLGQDVIETGLGAATAAGGQALFTDMTPEEIAASTALGVGAAAIGRPLMGRAGQAIGNRIDARNPKVRQYSEEMLEGMLDSGRMMGMEDVIAAKLAPYASQSPTAQLGQIFGRGYGDNVAQMLVALGAPLVVGGEE